jgi:hypothetical protein
MYYQIQKIYILILFIKYFLEFYIALLIKKDVCLLDGKFTNEKISNLGLSLETIIESEPLQESIKIACTSQLLRCLNDVTDNWSLTIFTSGTTRTPKKVKQTLTSLSSHVKKNLNIRMTNGHLFMILLIWQDCRFFFRHYLI